jgi:hypothetical protein
MNLSKIMVLATLGIPTIYFEYLEMHSKGYIEGLVV